LTADLLSTAQPYLAAARVALALWLMLASAHWIVGARVFGAAGLLPFARMAGRRLHHRLRRRLTMRLLQLWMAAQVAIAVWLLFAASPWLAVAGLIAALVSHGSFIWLNGEYVATGADKMGLIVLAGTAIATSAIAIGDTALLLAGCLVGGGQLLICYMVAGWSKLRQPAWRSGAELAGVMAHALWGAPWAARLVRWRGVALGASWALMLGEALFPLALFGGEPGLIAALAAMFGFHFATAIVMRLTQFPWAFVAAYPSVLLLGHLVRGALS
jgi:hypothetical protein